MIVDVVVRAESRTRGVVCRYGIYGVTLDLAGRAVRDARQPFGVPRDAKALVNRREADDSVVLHDGDHLDFF